jgi:hypothetical protein
MGDVGFRLFSVRYFLCALAWLSTIVTMREILLA